MNSPVTNIQAAPAVPVNPLAKHFRQPAIFTKLPSLGQFWEPGALELSVTGEIPVYPMTAKDEITLRTPDALLNGTSVVTVIESCCPSIKDAWKMPSVDVDYTLIAIRIASYGPSMDVSAKCPHCGEEHEYAVDLQSVLSKINMPDYSQTVTTGDNLTIKFKPLNYLEVSKAGNVAFEEQRLIQALSNPDLSEEVRKIEYEKHVKTMIGMQTDNVVSCTQAIIVDGQEVTNPKFIREYYENAGSIVTRNVQLKVKDFADIVNIKPETATCTDCGKNFDISIEFDYTRFFGKGF
jgi:hypothetical protein